MLHPPSSERESKSESPPHPRPQPQARLLPLRLVAAAILGANLPVFGGLLAYEPFTNALGANVLGSSGGFGFSSSWQTNSSVGVATNTGYALGYTDAASNTLASAGGAAFFQGATATSGAMQPIRRFDFSRGTNGVDGATTWISFLVWRRGPTGTLAGNPFGRGANVPHDLDSGSLQKLAVGNSSGATSNTVGLIPQGSGAALQGSAHAFGGVTNFIVVRIDHLTGAANDRAHLFVNPLLASEPALATAAAQSTNNFDFSFDRLRVFAGGESSTQQPFAELVLDEYRVGTNYADVAPIVTNPPVSSAALIITNARLTSNGIVLSGSGGSNHAPYLVLAADAPAMPAMDWSAIATNTFDAAGNFHSTNPIPPGVPLQFFRLLAGVSLPAPGVGPAISLQPTNVTVPAGSTANFIVSATGTAPLVYQWCFNTNTPLAQGTGSALAITNVQSTNLGLYSVIVTNHYGATTSSFALLALGSPLLPGAFFVSVNDGNDANTGTEASPYKTISKGLSRVASGGVVYVRAGTYPLSSKLTLNGTGASATNLIRLWAYPGEFPQFDGTGNSSDGISLSGKFYHLKGLTVFKAGHNGINISGHSNLVEFCTVRENGNTGLHITGGNGGTTYPSYNLILNCDAYLNYDPPIGGNADGFSAKWSLGPGNVFRGCRAWWNSDDGWDLWMGTDAVVIDGCWAFYHGTNYWNSPSFDGNGQGFKLGGNYIGAPHRLLRSVAFKNESNGVDQNNNILGQTLDHNTSWANKARNYSMAHGTNTTPHVIRNNLSLAGASSDSWTSGTQSTSNSWQVVTAPAANASDVLSVDESVVRGSRRADGSLPAWPFLRPVPGGRLIDRGVILGEPYNGTRPDLGAFEDGL